MGPIELHNILQVFPSSQRAFDIQEIRLLFDAFHEWRNPPKAAFKTKYRTSLSPMQGIIPFVLLTILNYRIYWVIKRRREMINRPAVIPSTVANTLSVSNANNSNSARPSTPQPRMAPPKISPAQRKANETQQAVVLFFIVLVSDVEYMESVDAHIFVPSIPALLHLPHPSLRPQRARVPHP